MWAWRALTPIVSVTFSWFDPATSSHTGSVCTFLKPAATLTISLGWLPTDEFSEGMSEIPSNSELASLNSLVPPCWEARPPWPASAAARVWLGRGGSRLGGDGGGDGSGAAALRAKCVPMIAGPEVRSAGKFCPAKRSMDWEGEVYENQDCILCGDDLSRKLFCSSARGGCKLQP
jgi:hypothetical protein